MSLPIMQTSINETSLLKGKELLITFPDGRNRVVQLDQPVLTLGRSTDNDLGYPEDSGLSRRHLTFEKEGKEWNVRDLGAKMGPA